MLKKEASEFFKITGSNYPNEYSAYPMNGRNKPNKQNKVT